jgi:hypothetical protein
MDGATPEPGPEDVLLLARHANLPLNEPYFGELLESYGHVHAMLVRQRASARRIGIDGSDAGESRK